MATINREGAMRLLPAVLAAALTATGAAASSNADALRQFGMLGHFAVDCRLPPSISNPHQTFAVDAGGAASRMLQMGVKDGTFPIWNIAILDPDRLQYEEHSNDLDFKITVVKIGKRFRSWDSVTTDGRVLIRDGRLGNGQDTQSFESCGGSA
jgi:hypothetical protein